MTENSSSFSTWFSDDNMQERDVVGNRLGRLGFGFVDAGTASTSWTWTDTATSLHRSRCFTHFDRPLWFHCQCHDSLRLFQVCCLESFRLLSINTLFHFSSFWKNRFKRLRTPANVFIINLTICDFLACCLHPLAVYSAFRGRWSFGQTGREREYII